MTPRWETALFLTVLIGAGAAAMVERVRNIVRDVVDDYPFYSLGVVFVIGFGLGISL